MDAGDPTAVARMAHKMKSSLAALGAIPGGRRGGGPGGGGAPGGRADVPDLASRFACELDRAVEALDRSIDAEPVA